MADFEENQDAIRAVQLALQVFWASSENQEAAQIVLSRSGIASIRDVALNCASLCQQLPVSVQREFSKRLYDLDATGCLMNSIAIGSFKGAKHVTVALQLLESNPQFSIEHDSVWTLGTSSTEDDGPLGFLKVLQRLQAVVVSVDELIALWTAGYTSALQISEAKAFASDMAGHGLGSHVSQVIQRAADSVKARNEHLLMLQAQSNIASQISIPVLDEATQSVSLYSPSPPAPEDSADTSGPIQAAHAFRSSVVEAPMMIETGRGEAPKQGPINLDVLFGDSLSVAVDENYSVTSPAAYFVDLLLFLKKAKVNSKAYPNVLDALSARRPDLQLLHLSRENTRVALPYIDLANEVLEACASFQYQKDQDSSGKEVPDLLAYNVSPDDRSADLVKAPRHVSPLATEALSNTITVNLPYDYDHDRLRESFRLLGTPWERFAALFRDPSLTPFKPSPAVDESALVATRTQAFDRSLVASYLGICELDYAYMTSERFWVLPGYAAGVEVLDAIPDQDQAWGLPPAADLNLKELSARIGILVDDLVGLIDSPYINPVKFELSQLELDFFRLAGPTLSAITAMSTEEETNSLLLDKAADGFFDDNSIHDETARVSFLESWITNVLPNVQETIVVNAYATDGSLDLNNMSFSQADGKKPALVFFQKLWTVCKLGKTLGWQLPLVSKTLYRSAQLTGITPTSPPTPGVLAQLASIVKLVAKLAVPVDQVLDLWITFSGTAAGSDYARIFLRHELVQGGLPGYVFHPDSHGRLHFTNNQTAHALSHHTSEIAAAFQCTVGDVTALVDALSAAALLDTSEHSSGELGLTNLAVLYRWTALKTMLGMDSASFSKFVHLYPHSLDDAVSAYAAITEWLELEEHGLEVDVADLAVRQPLPQPQENGDVFTNGLLMLFALRQAWADIQQRLRSPAKGAPVTDDDLSKAALLLYDSTTVASLVSFLSGAYVYVDEVVDLSPLFFKDANSDGSGGEDVDEDEEPDLSPQTKPSTVSAKITYRAIDRSQFTVRIAGLLSEQEADTAMLAVDQEKTDRASVDRWEAAIKSARDDGHHAQDLFERLAPKATGLEKRRESLRKKLLRPDAPPSSSDPSLATSTPGHALADDKRSRYLDYFVPLARQHLIHKAINDALQTYLDGSLSPPVLEYLLHGILLGDRASSTNQVGLGTIADKLAHAISPDVHLVDLEDAVPSAPSEKPVTAQARAAPEDQTSYLYVATAGTYTFSLSQDPSRNSKGLGKGHSLFIAGQKVGFGESMTSQPLVLLQGQICAITNSTVPLSCLDWQPARGAKSSISSQLIISSTDVSDSLVPALQALKILSGLVVTYSLSFDDLALVVPAIIEGVRLFTEDSRAALTMDHVRRLDAYFEVRSRLPALSQKGGSSAELLRWYATERKSPDIITRLAAKLDELYGWPADMCSYLLSINGFPDDGSLVDMTMELKRLLDQVGVLSSLGLLEKPGSARSLCELAAPAPYKMINNKVLDTSQLASPDESSAGRDTTVSSIVVLAASRSTSDSVQKMHNGLRERRRDALVNYLIQGDYFRGKNIVDADGLFEHLLIDSQINSAMVTSRLKQAISTVQLFVQRCLLGLEAPHGVQSKDIKTDEWDWMQKYTLWQANREVFMYPENWLDPPLRPLKSPQYQQFETSLTAKDVSQQSLDAAVRQYVMSVVEIANLEPVSLYLEKMRPGDVVGSAGSMGIGRASGRRPRMVHIIARTRHKPYVFYYRTRDCLGAQNFTPWERMDVDITVYETDLYGKPLATPGSYVIPYRAGNRLFLVLPQFSVSIAPEGGSTKMTQDKDGAYIGESSGSENRKSWKLQLAVTEYVNGRWTPKHIFNDSLPTMPQLGQLGEGPVFGEWGGPFADKGGDHGQCYAASVGKGSVESPTSADKNQSSAAKKTILGPPTIQNYRFWPYQLADDDENTLRIDVSWHFPCKVHDKHGHRAGVTTTTLRCGRLQPGALQVAPKDYKTGSSLAVLSEREVWNTVFQKAVFQFSAPVLAGHLTKPLQYMDPTMSDVDMPEPRIGALMSFNDQASWADSSPLVYMTEPNADGIGLASALNFEARVAPTWDAVTPRGTAPGIVTRMPMVYAQAADLATEATWGSDAVYKYLHGLDPAEHSAFTDKGDLSFCKDGTLAFGPGAMEMTAPYSQYNAELGVHMPMAMTARFAASQQFEAALAAARLVFNPLEEGMDTNRCWKWPPFRTLDAVNEVQRVLGGASDAHLDAMESWRADPFSPYVVAMSRPSTYMKWMVTKYIEVLVAYGDSYFRQNTLESIPYALNLYVQASKLFGPAPQTLRDPSQARRTTTFSQVASQLDYFANALVDMEVQFPFVVRTVSSTPSAPVENTMATRVATNTLQTAMTRYFGLPANPRVAALRDLIDDRLFKIRNYLDINGHAQVLPLFDPPLDPGSLVGAVAGGAWISQLSSDAGTTMANFRFPYLLAKALELCGELKQLSSAFLRAKQDGDSEAMAVMRTQQEAVMHESALQLRKLQLEEATLSLESLREARLGPVMRLQHYLALTGDPISRVPEPGADFSEIDAQIQAPTKDGLRMSPLEKLEMDKQDEATFYNSAAGAFSTLAGIMAAIPDIEENIMPVGAGVTLKAGPALVGKAAEAMSTASKLMSEAATIEAGNAGTAAVFTSRLQERYLQANTAGREIKVIDKQTVVQQKRVEAVTLEMETQQRQREHTAKTLEFLRDKYTNVELFAWMEAAVRSSLYDMYTLAYDTAKKAEMAYAFERGTTGTTPFIRPGYWDAGHDGMLSGDGLYLGLKKMEAAYMEGRGHDYEITKYISLRSLSPLGLLTLRRTGTVDFALPEALFDMDFPGHFRRRIKTVALSVPCEAEPYTSISCTLRLLSHRYRYTAAQAASSKDYAEAEGGDPRFRTNLVPVTAIAVSTAQNDAGMFDLDFRGERYLPFEGAGAVSRWRLELPGDLRLFDYETIGDVVMHLRYTSADGGERLKTAASGSLLASLGKLNVAGDGSTAPLTAVLDLKNDFAAEWQRFSAAGEAGRRTMTLSGLRGHLPFYAKSVTARRPVATQVTAVAGKGTSVTGLKLGLEGRAFDVQAEGVGFRMNGTGIAMGFDKGWTLTAAVGEAEAVGRVWLLVHYRLK